MSRARKEFVTVPLPIRGPFHVEGTRYFVVENESKYYVVKDYCKHRGGPLSLGSVDANRGTITCPWHGMKTCVNRLVDSAEPALRRGNSITFAVSR